jgi:hypothetical protein
MAKRAAQAIQLITRYKHRAIQNLRIISFQGSIEGTHFCAPLLIISR